MELKNFLKMWFSQASLGQSFFTYKMGRLVSGVWALWGYTNQVYFKELSNTGKQKA